MKYADILIDLLGCFSLIQWNDLVTCIIWQGLDKGVERRSDGEWATGHPKPPDVSFHQPGVSYINAGEEDEMVNQLIVSFPVQPATLSLPLSTLLLLPACPVAS